MGYGFGRNKAIAFKAVPNVIKHGKIIDVQWNWKDRGMDTVVLAAPIDILNKEYYVGLVVERNIANNSQNYYLHELEIIKRSNSLQDTGAYTKGTSRNRGSSTAPLLSLLQMLNDVNSGESLESIEEKIPTHESKFSLEATVEKTYKLISLYKLDEYKLINQLK